MSSQTDGADTNFLFKYYNRAWSDPLSVVYGKAVLGMAKNGFYIRAHIFVHRLWTFYMSMFYLLLCQCCIDVVLRIETTMPNTLSYVLFVMPETSPAIFSHQDCLS